MINFWPKRIVAVQIALLCCALLLGCREKSPVANRPMKAKTSASATPPKTVKPDSSAQQTATDSQPSTQTPAPSTAADTTEKSTTTAEVTDDTPEVAPTTAAEDDSVTDAQSNTTADATAQTATDPQPPAEEPPQAQRVMLLAPGGPLLVDLLMTIDGHPHDRPLSNVVADALKNADADQDGKTTWDEVTQDGRLRYGELGNLASRNENERLQLIRMYDHDRNGMADLSEMRRFLTRNAAGSKSFNLRSSNYYRDANRWESPIRQLLDDNGDGALDSQELALAAMKLKAHDADDDEALQLEDLIEVRPGDIGPLQSRRTDEVESAVHLNDIRDWGQLLYTLEEEYSLGRELQPDSFSREPQLFGELDQNGDGEIRADELPKILELAPHLQLEIAFGAASEQSGEQSMLKLIGHPREVPVEITESKAVARLTCAWSDVVVVFFARDAITRDYLVPAKQQVTQFDGNKDGYLEENELPEFFADTVAQFAALDSDKDGKVYAEELAAFQEKQQATMRSQLRARAGDDRDALFTALDDDHDGRLTAREIEHSNERILAMDQDDDDQVIVDEIPTAMLLGVIRSDPQMDDQFFTPPTAANVTDQERPNWFTSMDVNRDNEISRREFLGDLAIFDQMDQDDDGFLNASEAVAAPPQ